MTDRVTRLEAEFEHVRKDLDEIRTDQKAILQRLAELPTKADLTSWKLQWTAIGVGAIILVVSLTFGGISLIVTAIQTG